MQGTLPVPERWFCRGLRTDGRTLAAGSNDGTIRLWDVYTSQEIGQFKGHQGAVTALTFTPNGKALISGSADTTALVWNVERLARPPVGLPSVLDAKMQESLWKTLADANTEVSFKAMRTLAAAPEAAVAIGKRLRPVEPLDRLKQLLANMQSKQFSLREKSAAELTKLGNLAEFALREALAGRPSLEFRRRLEKLLERAISAPWPPEQLRAVRMVEVLEQTASADARQLLQDLAKGEPNTRLTHEAKAAVQRLAAFPATR